MLLDLQIPIPLNKGEPAQQGGGGFARHSGLSLPRIARMSVTTEKPPGDSYRRAAYSCLNKHSKSNQGDDLGSN